MSYVQLTSEDIRSNFVFRFQLLQKRRTHFLQLTSECFICYGHVHLQYGRLRKTIYSFPYGNLLTKVILP